MINRLIDLDVNIGLNQNKEINNGRYSIQQYVSSFLNGLEKSQKERFKQMLNNNFVNLNCIAKSYNINVDEFEKELKRQLNLKEDK